MCEILTGFTSNIVLDNKKDPLEDLWLFYICIFNLHIWWLP